MHTSIVLHFLWDIFPLRWLHLCKLILFEQKIVVNRLLLFGETGCEGLRLCDPVRHGMAQNASLISGCNENDPPLNFSELPAPSIINFYASKVH